MAWPRAMPRFRPGYPAEIVTHLVELELLSRGDHIVDLGCGTGLLAKCFLDDGYPVTGIEPNADMRRAGIQFLSSYPSFANLPGSVESTGLPAASTDLVISGQAFHWFDADAARCEQFEYCESPWPHWSGMNGRTSAV